jgi:cytochrome c oxidase subunit 2
VDEDVLVQLKSMDVLHSFFLPNLRIKQDAVPGMKIPVWFKGTETGSWDIVCAELCGWGHYKMKGRITFVTRPEFDAWLARKTAEQDATQPVAEATGEIVAN